MEKKFFLNFTGIRIFFLFFCIFPLSVSAQSCSEMSLDSADDVERVQACVKDLQRDMENLLYAQDNVIAEIISNLNILIKNEANCLIIEKNFGINPAITGVMVKDCERWGKKMAIQWSQAGARIKNLRENQNLTKQHNEALKLKLMQIQAVAERFRERKK
jgi:hypothetical protein